MNHTPRVRSFRRVSQAFALSILFPLGLTAQINFYGIGDLTGGDTFSQVRDATRVDGNIIAVGTSSRYFVDVNFTPLSGDTPVSWTTDGLVVLPEVGSGLGTPNGSGEYKIKFVTARVITLDGSLIGGSEHDSASLLSRQPSLWTNSGTPVVTGLGYLGTVAASNANNGGVNGLSADGTVAYGFDSYVSTGGGMQAFRYTSDGGMVALGFLNSGDNGSFPAAHAVSTNGTVMVGNSYNSTNSPGGGFGPGTQAFRYTYTNPITEANPTGGPIITALSFLLNEGTWNTALAMTPNGTKAIGIANSSDFLNGQLVSWDSSGAVTALGSPNPAYGFVNLGGVSADGSVVVVSAGDAIDVNALSIAYFKNTYGWFDFQTAMTLARVNLSGWTLTDVLGISADGTLVYATACITASPRVLC